MKRISIGTLMMTLAALGISLSTGCASPQGAYFERTRDHRPHVFEDRIYNPADYRYKALPDTGRCPSKCDPAA